MGRPPKSFGTRYKRVREELNEIFSELDEKTKKITVKLLDNAAFMALKLEDLQAEINKNGMVTEYQNGANQFGTKKSPEVEVYLSMIKNYTAIVNTLMNALPDDSSAGSAANNLLDFINRGNKNGNSS